MVPPSVTTRAAVIEALPLMDPSRMMLVPISFTLPPIIGGGDDCFGHGHYVAVDGAVDPHRFPGQPHVAFAASAKGRATARCAPYISFVGSVQRQWATAADKQVVLEDSFCFGHAGSHPLLLSNGLPGRNPIDIGGQKVSRVRLEGERSEKAKE